MKKLFLAIPLLASSMALASCEGSIASAVGKASNSSFSDGIEIGTADTDPGEFTGVTLAGPDNIVFTTGSSFSIRAEGDNDALEELRYSVKNGQLKVGRDSVGKIWSGSDGAATVYVSAPVLNSAKLAGSGDMNVDQMADESAELSIAGSGNINIAEIKTASLSAKIAGSGDMVMAGTADNVNVSIAGSGEVSGKELKADKATIKVAGSGDVTLSSDGSVDAKVMGSGDIRVHGKADCKSKSMGSGDINCG